MLPTTFSDLVLLFLFVSSCVMLVQASIRALAMVPASQCHLASSFASYVLDLLTLSFSCCFSWMCQLGLNPNPSTPVFPTVLMPVIESVLSFPHRCLLLFFRTRSTMCSGLYSTYRRCHPCRSVEQPAVFPTPTPTSSPSLGSY
jgi:hypothetical protein